MRFTITNSWLKARNGRLETPHGNIQTPVFMPVGTQASVKSLSPDDLTEAGAEIILGNTYHLYLRPGDDLIASLGGLHQFNGWKKPILTDSGGFQVSSLGHFQDHKKNVDGYASKLNLKRTQIDDDGVTFWSHLNGAEHRLTPEKSIQIQENLGADIIMAFDEATPSKGREYSLQAMHRTHAWLERSIQEWQRLESAKIDKPAQALFGIVQGGDFRDLRQESARFITSCDLPGVGIGGGSIGADWRVTSEQVGWFYDDLPKEKPIYFMGVGVNPEDLVAAILAGADMFDCVAPTRLARTGILYNGQLLFENKPISREESKIQNILFEEILMQKPKVSYVSEYRRGRVIIGNAQYTQDTRPIQENCDCYTCRSGFSRAYLRHLFKAKELLYYRLASIHNIRCMIRIVEQMRDLISQQS